MLFCLVLLPSLSAFPVAEHLPLSPSSFSLCVYNRHCYPFPLVPVAAATWSWKPHTPCISTLAFFAGFWLSTDFSSQEQSHFVVHDKQCCSFHWEMLEASSAPAAQSPRTSLKNCSWRLAALLPLLQLSEVTDRILVLEMVPYKGYKNFQSWT